MDLDYSDATIIQLALPVVSHGWMMTIFLSLLGLAFLRVASLAFFMLYGNGAMLILKQVQLLPAHKAGGLIIQRAAELMDE